MTPPLRLGVKLLVAALLLVVLMLYARTAADFVYTGF
jgi:hypothetical protein